VDIERELPTRHRHVRYVGGVKRRKDPWLQVGARCGAMFPIFLYFEMHCPQIEVIPVVEPGKVDLGAMDIAVVSVEPVGVGEILVGLEKNIPAEVPAGVDGKLALRAHHAAKLVRVVGRAAVRSEEHTSELQSRE